MLAVEGARHAVRAPLRRHCLQLRRQSTSTRPQVYVSRSHSPLFNLSIEEHLLRTTAPTTPLLFIYRNSPCIVLGRNQNHWKELNVGAMQERHLPLIRRRSGGGAVYHDLGNTNFSLHVARERFERRMGAEMIARALNGPGVGLRTLRSDEASPPAERFAIGQGSPEGAYVNERHDLVVRVVDQAASSGSHESHWAERKISGSAFKILTHRAYHHGTMLLSSDLSALGSSLRNVKTNAMKSKGVESVKSPVVNLSAAYPSAAKQGRLDHEKFTRAVVREFWNTYDAESGRDEARGGSVLEELGRGWVDVHEDLPLAKEPERVKLEKLLGEWDWIYASCPEFEVVIQAREYKGKGRLRELGLGEGAALKVHCKNGIVLNAEMEGGDGDEWEQVVKGIVGQRYDTFAECPPMPGGSACAREEVSGDARRRRAIEALGEHDQQIKTALVEWLHEAL